MKQRPTYLIKTTLFALLLSWLLLAAGPAYATSVRAVPLLQASCTLPATVTTASQLRDCITAANGNGAGLDTITLGADITLTLTLPQITTAITLEGAGYTLDGANSRQIFNVGTAGDLTINEATLQNGFATNGGGAVYNDGTLTLINSTLSGNSAAAGAAVFNFLASTFTATNSTFSGNTATTNGGAIYNLDTMILTSNTFADNAAPTGGSLYNATPRGYLAGNIFAKGTNGANCVTGAAINDNGYNLSDDATCTNGGFDSQTNVTLNLGALTDNGGLTPTHLP
ncbi:MAG: hypothetical protein KC423_26880, partial [Anaerolineales bacterium]|nr:hypothetical protein [Anaerolineales bacterium]